MVSRRQTGRARCQPFLVAAAATVACALAAAEPAPTGTVSRSVGMVEAYQDLLKENLELRGQTTSLGEERDAARRERDRLQAGVGDLEKQLVETASALQALQKAQEAQASAAAESASLQGRLAAADAERSRLAAELAALQARTAADQDLAAGPAVVPDSDIFRKVEAERVALQQRIVAVEAERTEAARAAEALRVKAEGDSAETERLRALLQVQASDRQAMAQVVPHVRRLQARQRELEQELAACKAEKDAAEKRAEELDVRVRQLTKLSSRLLRGSSGGPQGVSGGPEGSAASAGVPADPFDAFCQAAAGLAGKSQFKQAAAAYLRALRLRPDAADVHYNLGVIYDQELGDSRRAVRHYGDYLRLRPHAADSDQVRAWLMEARIRE